MVMLTTEFRRALRATTLEWARRLAPASRRSVREALELLTPWDVGVPLIRVGGDADGGYLVPDDLLGVEAVPSPGVSDPWDFETFGEGRYGMRSFTTDGSVEAPSGLSHHSQGRQRRQLSRA